MRWGGMFVAGEKALPAPAATLVTAGGPPKKYGGAPGKPANGGGGAGVP